MTPKQRLQAIQDRIAKACDSVRRDPADVQLVAVSKTQPLDAIRALYDLGIRSFGESRLQEAQPKIEALPPDIVWHFIGSLQSNKAKRIAANFDVIHTLATDTSLREVEKAGRLVDGLIEVNIALEMQKAGKLPNEVDDFAKSVLECSQVRFRGLMTIGPSVDDPEEMRQYFRSLRALNERAGGLWLSMGMSHDFEVAIQEGSTHIRVGTALFGERT